MYTKLMSDQKGFTAIFIFPLVLVGLVFVYWVYWYMGSILHNSTPQTSITNLVVHNPSSTSNVISSPSSTLSNNVDIVSFTDAQNFISFSYPAGASQVSSKSPSPTGGLAFDAYYNKFGDPNFWSITVVGIPLTDKTITWDVKKPKILQECQGKIFSCSEIADITLGGEKAVTWARTDNQGNSGKLIETLHNGIEYSIGLGTIKQSTEIKMITNQAYQIILNSFRFLK